MLRPGMADTFMNLSAVPIVGRQAQNRNPVVDIVRICVGRPDQYNRPKFVIS